MTEINVEDDELEDLQTLAAQWLGSAAKIAAAGILIEVKCDDEDDEKKEHSLSRLREELNELANAMHE